MAEADMSEVTAVILAGGKGTRIAHLLRDVPKPMACVAGRPFLDWVLLQLAHDGIGSFLLSTGHLGEVIAEHLANRPVADIRTRCVCEDVPCGTAGGFLNAVHAESEVPCGGYLVVNGDSMVMADTRSLVREARQQGWDAALFGLAVEDARRYGSLNVSTNGLLNGFNEKGAASGVINAGVYWFSAECVARFPSQMPLSFEFDVFPALIKSGVRIGVVEIAAPFIDIGTPESMAQAETFIRSHLTL